MPAKLKLAFIAFVVTILFIGCGKPAPLGGFSPALQLSKSIRIQVEIRG